MNNCSLEPYYSLIFNNKAKKSHFWLPFFEDIDFLCSFCGELAHLPLNWCAFVKKIRGIIDENKVKL